MEDADPMQRIGPGIAPTYAASEYSVHKSRALLLIENLDRLTRKTASRPSPSRRPGDQACLSGEAYPSTGAQYALLASRVAKPVYDGFNRRSTSLECLDVHARDTRKKFDWQSGPTTRFGHQGVSV
jgi:hypothetical protein